MLKAVFDIWHFYVSEKASQLFVDRANKAREYWVIPLLLN